MAMIVLVIAALTSLMRGGRYVHEEETAAATISAATATEAAGTDIVADDVAAQDADRAGNAAEVSVPAVRGGDGHANPDS
jgi:hypothetical protein